MLFLAKLKYIEGAIPGKPLIKRKLTSPAPTKGQKVRNMKGPGQNRRFLNILWQKDRSWLNYDQAKKS